MSPRIKFGLLIVLVGVCVPGLIGCSKHRKAVVAENETLFAKAKDSIGRRKFLEAISLLGDVGIVDPVSDNLDPEIKLALAESYYYQSGSINVVEAQSRYENFLNFYPDHPKAPYARYMVGVCLMDQAADPENDQEFSEKALRHYQVMLEGLPENSPWIQPSRVMLAKAQDRLAEHEWLVAQFYLERKAYAGAGARLETLLTRYPASRRRGEALLNLGLARHGEGKNDSARATLEQVIQEFPQTPLAEQARKLGAEWAAVPNAPKVTETGKKSG